MLDGLIGSATSVGRLNETLDKTAERVRGIAHRVSNAANRSGQSFGDAMDDAGGPPPSADGAVDLEREMTALANEKIHYDASVRLLQKVYRQVRSSVQGGR
ncbi:MAG: hypothetical protein Q8W44_12215 [Candidatus Palauibacterales bacterium]|nr:hypothetical protein [Candidatus Palauibacterales bacterium]